MIRRMPILLVLTALLSCTWVATAAAPLFPARPIRFVVGFAPGGGNDLLARIVGQKVSERLGQQVVIDNRPGAGGNLGAELAARSTPDGHTILMMSSSHPIQGLLKHRLPYDPIADFAPISRLATYSYLLVVHPNLPARSTKELVAAAKSASPAMIFVSSGNGSGSHLAGELFKSVAGVDLTHVPYKGTAQAITDLIAGRVQLMFSPMPAVIQHVRAGRLRVVAFTGSRRSAQLPDVPTVAESGIAQFVVSPWYGVIAPARVPPAVVATLNRHINDVLKLPEIEQQLRSEGAEPSGSTPQEFARLIRAEHDKWREVIARTGIKVD